ncbi:MAG: EF-hand domain-containing protein [Myxococcota bacterium]
MASAGSPAAGHADRNASQAKADRMLKKFDQNRDGVLDRNELAAAHAQRKQRRQQMKQRFDRDGDGRLNPAERQAAKRAMAQQRRTKRFDRMLKRLDSNRDGVLSWSEVQAKLGGMPAERAARMSNRFRAADTNSDGVVTRAEFGSARLRGQGARGHR